MQERAPEFAERVRAYEKRCREAGIPLTVQRRVIFEAILRRDDHPTAEHIYEALQARVPEISRATIYRALETLVQLGVIARAHHLGPANRFDPNTGHHHCLVCTRCNRVTDYDDARLDGLPLPDLSLTDFQTTDFSIHFNGLCGGCRREAAARTTP